MPGCNETELPKWMTSTSKGTTLTVRAVPRASRSEIASREDEWLKVRLKAPPVDGQANKELIAFFSKLLKVPKSRVEICSGESSRLKRIFIGDLSSDDILQRIL